MFFLLFLFIIIQVHKATVKRPDMVLLRIVFCVHSRVLLNVELQYVLYAWVMTLSLRKTVSLESVSHSNSQSIGVRTQ